MTIPRRTPRSPSIGFCSCRRVTAASSRCVLVSDLSRSSSSATCTESSVKSGRNSCRGGSISRIVTGRPSIASRIPLKSSRCRGSSSRQRGLLPRLVVGDDQVLDQGSPFAEEHVLGTAEADSLGAEPASPGGVLRVSAFDRTRSRLRLSACPISISTAVASSPSTALPSKQAYDVGVDDRHLAEEHLSGGAVDREDVALLDDLAVPRPELPLSTFTLSASAPQTQVRPIPRATTAACDVLPPRLVRMPRAATIPRKSSGLVSLRTRITASPWSAQLHGSVGVEDGLAHRCTG